MSDVTEIGPSASEKKFPVMLGLIPCWNRFFLDPVWAVIRTGVDELVNLSFGEFSALYIWQQVFSGRFQLYVAYLDQTGTATEARFQEMFVEKLRTPEKDYAGFFILDIMREKSIHVFAAYIVPEYRDKNLWEIGFNYIESQVKALGAKEISVTMPGFTLESMKRRGFVEGFLNMRKFF